MSSHYPVLDNRPINQWKVTELREELRRRNIPTKGLKEELVRKLDEAIRNERGEEVIQEGELGNGFDPDAHPQDKGGQEEAEPMAEEQTNAVADGIEKTEHDATMVEMDHHTLVVNQDIKAQDGDIAPVAELDGDVAPVTELDGDVAPVTELDAVAAETAVKVVSMEDSASEIESVVPHCDSSGQDSRSDEKPKDLKPLVEDVKCSLLEPADQVSEVSPDLGPKVKCESISTDSVSIIEKNELKDNLNADNFHLELDVVKPEMVQPSSSDVPPIGGDSHPLEDDKELVKNQISLEETDIKYATNVDLSKKEDIPDGGSPEKLNLDRSSGDESMEEDVSESKHIESNIKSDELGERTEVSKGHAVEEGNHDDAKVDRSSPDKKDTVNEEKMEAAAPSEKRKLEGHEAVGSNETIKRQRRWNPDTIKVPERQTSNISTSSTPKDAIQATPKRTFNRSDSTVSGDSPKERIVPPPLKPATTSLRIDRFLRPFTLKAVQELLAKTGSVCSFWMDHIKTHCYVTYSSVEEAVATRNAVYNLQWPSNGGRLLVAEFVDPQEVKMRLEAPPQSPTPVSPTPTASKSPPFPQPQPPPPQRQHASRQQLPPPPTLPPPPPLSNPPAVRERLPPPPSAEKKPEPPVVTLDDLFKKTKATPRIYYLPLSEEQVSAKLAVQGTGIKETDSFPCH